MTEKVEEAAPPQWYQLSMKVRVPRVASVEAETLAGAIASVISPGKTALFADIEMVPIGEPAR